VNEVAKPLKQFADGQSKARKPIEATVEKATKTLSDKRSDELRCKRNNHTKSREREIAHEQLEEAKSGRKPTSDKDIQRAEVKVEKATESAAKQDQEYLEVCKKAEEARQLWEATMYNCCQKFQAMEEERCLHIKEMIAKYSGMLATIAPTFQESCETINSNTDLINPSFDVSEGTQKFGTAPNVPDQVLYTCFEEDLQSSMNGNRRREILRAKLWGVQKLVKQARKVQEGISNLSSVYKETPSYANDETQNDVYRQLAAANAMIDYYDSCRYRLLCALTEANGQPKPGHRLSQFLTSMRDKQNIVHASLQVPVQRGGMRNVPEVDDDIDVLSMTSAQSPSRSSQELPVSQEIPISAIPQAAEVPDQHSADEFDDNDFESDGNEEIKCKETEADLGGPPGQVPQYICQCRVEYEYKANQADELNISPGDVIYVYVQQEDGWWQGDLNGTMGIFPASYVTVL
jgi:hypothetical protein